MLVYQFYSELCDFQPKIRRRFQTAPNISLARLGYIVMTLYEMQGHHLFDMDYRKTVSLPGVDFDRSVRIRHYVMPQTRDSGSAGDGDATKEKISKLNLDPPHELLLEYDFGDSWMVAIRLEKKLDIPDLTAKDLPRVLKGSGWGIVEDCGGVCGLDELVEAFARKKGESYEDLREWMGVDDFDINRFDLDEMNFRVKEVPPILANIYEKKKTPTAKQIDIMERNYKR